MGTDRDPVLKFKAFERSVVVLFLAIVCIKCMEPLSFDSPAETESSLRPQRFFCQSRSGLEPGTSRTATTRSSHSAAEAPGEEEKQENKEKEK